MKTITFSYSFTKKKKTLHKKINESNIYIFQIRYYHEQGKTDRRMKALNYLKRLKPKENQKY